MKLVSAGCLDRLRAISVGGSYAGYFFSGEYSFVGQQPGMTPLLPTAPYSLVLYLQFYCFNSAGKFTASVAPTAPYAASDFTRDFSHSGQTGPQNFSSIDIS